MKHGLRKKLTKMLLLTWVASFYFCAALPRNAYSQENSKPVSAEELKSLVPKAYKEFADDLKLLRKTYLLTNGDGSKINASSGEAIEAAVRIFKNVAFVGMTREQVLRILGDPKTISDYGVATGNKPDDSFFYRFDHGFGGVEYVLRFKDGKVIKLDAGGLY